MTDFRPRGPRQPILNLPPMTTALLIANIAVAVALWLLPERLDQQLLLVFGFLPVRYAGAVPLGWPALVAPVTYQFLHGGLTHLGVNMLGLVAFAPGVEQRLGGWRFLIFYLVCGIAGAFAQFAAGPTSFELLIGASAAVSGIFGAILRFRIARQSFWLVVAIWLVMNFVTGASGMGSSAPIAWIAHIGGFFAGLILFSLFDRRLGARR
ncbi:MAG TPA: rhomboid family intramembrane serine protease [Stellaceae bacterium]|nr:rhomboid family intramembrane serine protease [Stellaceae bacterium]